MHIDYAKEYWCTYCGRKRDPDETRHDQIGTVRCRQCGRPVRTRPYKGIPKAERHYIEVEP